MGITVAGHQQLAVCDLGTLATTPVDPILMGIQKDHGYEREAYMPPKSYLQKAYRTLGMETHRIKASTLQSTMFLQKKLDSWVNGNCDVQLLENKQSSGVNYGNVLKFVGNRKLGLEYETLFTSEERLIKPTFEVALPYADSKAFVDAADSETPVQVLSTYKAGDNETYLRGPYFLAFEAPKTTTILARDEIVERSYSRKTLAIKSKENNMSIVHYVLYEIIIKFRNATIAKQVEIMAKDNCPSLYIKENNNASFYDAWDFAANALSLDHKYNNTHADVDLTLKFMGQVFLFDHTYQFGAAYGGDVSDGGTKGGTMVIGA